MSFLEKETRMILNLWIMLLSFVNCEWIEISQTPTVADGSDEQSDYASYMLTTTSSTTQTPILLKPTIANNKRIKKIFPAEDDIRLDKVVLQHAKNSEEIDVFDIANNNRGKSFNDPEYLEGNGYSNFIPYMSVIQNALMKNAHNDKKSKLGVLQNLRDHLLSEIQNRISTLWKPSNRKTREYKEDSHMEFPSNEGALMTIGFLTFAVFLIKLVMQLVQAIGQKTETSTTTTTTYYERKRRSTDLNEDSLKILNYLEKYDFKNRKH